MWAGISGAVAIVGITAQARIFGDPDGIRVEINHVPGAGVLAPGIEFFTWARRMTVDAFYTSPIGIKDIDYRGNSPMASYPEPAEQIAYVLKRLPSL